MGHPRTLATPNAVAGEDGECPFFLHGVVRSGEPHGRDRRAQVRGRTRTEPLAGHQTGAQEDRDLCPQGSGCQLTRLGVSAHQDSARRPCSWVSLHANIFPVVVTSAAGVLCACCSGIRNISAGTRGAGNPGPGMPSCIEMSPSLLMQGVPVTCHASTVLGYPLANRNYLPVKMCA